MTNEEVSNLKSKISNVIFTTVGESSTCWVNFPAGVFDSDAAVRVGEETVAKIMTLIVEAQSSSETNKTSNDKNNANYMSNYIWK